LKETGCSGGLQAFHSRADQIFRSSEHSLAGLLVDPYLVWPVSLESERAVASALQAQFSQRAAWVRDSRVAAGNSAEQDSFQQEAHSNQVGCPAGLQADRIFQRSEHSRAGYPVDPCWALHLAWPASLESERAVACVRWAEGSATAERARDSLNPAWNSAELEAHSKWADCPAGLQAAHLRVYRIFRASEHSPVGCPVAPCLASPVSPEAPV
jgi:hypothetical protein